MASINQAVEAVRRMDDAIKRDPHGTKTLAGAAAVFMLGRITADELERHARAIIAGRPLSLR